jgi:hypothetical protein
MTLDERIKMYRAMQDIANALHESIMKDLTLWQSKALCGFFIEAMTQYRKEHNCSFEEARNAVKAFLAQNGGE